LDARIISMTAGSKIDNFLQVITTAYATMQYCTENRCFPYIVRASMTVAFKR
jgi:hypothetical protein